MQASPIMANAASSSTSHPVPVSVDQALAMVQINGWLSPAHLDKIRADLQKVSGADGRSLLAHLVNANLLTKDQAGELKTLIQHQATLPQFTFLKKLGSGGMGTVFLIREGLAENSRLLALKTINARLSGYEDFVGRFKRETTALEGMAHPHIAGVISSGESHGVCYLAMEYIEGPSLASLLTESKVLPEAYVLEMMRQIAAGLAHVWNHAKLVHRDIKPENVLILKAKDASDKFPLADTAKLIDFGLVKPSNEADDLHLTQTGMTIGTPLYMSPEQIRGEELDCRSDVYGLASTMFHLLTGITPYTGTSPGAIMSAHLTQAVPDPGERVPGLHAGTRKLVMTGMAKKVLDRFMGHEAFIHAIEQVQKEIAGRSTSQVKLLRKPMVLKTPMRKVVTEPAPAAAPQPTTSDAAPPGKPAAGHDGPGTDREQLTARIVHKHQHGGDEHGDTSANQAVVLPTMTDRVTARPTPSTPAARTASEVLLQARTDRIERLRRQHHQEQSPVPDDILTGTDGTGRRSVAIGSSIYHEDPAHSVGTGAMPWLVLGGAGILMVVYLILSLMGIVG